MPLKLRLMRHYWPSTQSFFGDMAYGIPGSERLAELLPSEVFHYLDLPKEAAFFIGAHALGRRDELADTRCTVLPAGFSRVEIADAVKAAKAVNAGKARSWGFSLPAS